MVGGPGAGKGTQAMLLAQKLGLLHVSSGDLFRDNIRRETALGKKVKSYLDKGALVPDDLTVQMVETRLDEPDAQNGVVLDGFPRTRAQAEALDKMLAKRGAKVDQAALRRCRPGRSHSPPVRPLDLLQDAGPRVPRDRQAAQGGRQVRHRWRAACPARRRQAGNNSCSAGAAAAAHVRSRGLLRAAQGAQHGQCQPARSTKSLTR